MTPRSTWRRAGVAYAATLVAFLLLDAVWLTTMAERLYRPAIGHLMQPGFAWEPALLFYALYILGLVVFGVSAGLERGSSSVAAARCALFGLIAYATYDLTNQATLQGWPWIVTLADLAWGTVASGVAGGVACRATLASESRRASARSIDQMPTSEPIARAIALSNTRRPCTEARQMHSPPSSSTG